MPVTGTMKKTANVVVRRAPVGSAPDNRKTVPWEELDEDTHLLIRRTTEGSLEGLQALVAWMELSKLTARQDRLVPILFHHLEKEPPDEISSGTGFLKAKYAAAALEGVLQSFLWQMSVEKIFTCLTFQYFDRHWTSIWKWMSAIHTRISSPGLFHAKDAPANDINTALTIRRLVVTLNERKACTPKLLSTPGAIPLLVDIWVKLSDMPAHDRHSSDMHNWSITTGSLMTVIHDDSKGQVMAAVGGDMARFASLTLKCLRVFSQDTTNPQASTSVLTLLAFISVTSAMLPGMSTHLLAQHSIIEMMHTFAFYADKKPPRENDIEHCYLVRSAAWSSLLYVQSTAAVTDGFTWITQAVRAQLIQSMLKSVTIMPKVDAYLPTLPPELSKTMSFEALEELVILIFALLSNFLIYRSLTREVERAMADPVVAKLEKLIPQDAKFWKAWIKFKVVVEIRSAFRHDFDKVEKYSQPCSAADCSNRETTRYFKLCSACQTSPYCSKACQARDWKSGVHKTFCRKIREERAAGIPVPMSDTDYQFLQYSGERDIRKYRAQIVASRDALYASGKAKEVMIFADYSGACGAPLAYVVDAPDAYPNNRKELLPGQWKPGGILPRTHLVINVPYGKTHHPYYFGGDADGRPWDLWINSLLHEAPAERDALEPESPFPVRVERAADTFSIRNPVPWLLGD